jgi:LmbE family N-acetylglucosaminyl deacetylase
VQQEIHAVDNDIAQCLQAEAYPEVAWLDSIPGLGKVFSAAIAAEIAGIQQDAFRPRLLFQYLQDRYIEPDIIVDVTEFWDKKMECILAFKTQFFNPDSEEKETYISTPSFLKVVEARSRELGKAIGAEHAEGFTSRKLLGIDNLFDLR